MASLILTPNPIAPSQNLRIDGAGFDPKQKVQLALDGAGWTTNYFRPAADGTFHVGVNVGSAVKTQTVTARYAGTTIIVATATIVVQKVVVPPPPPPPLPGIVVPSSIDATGQTGVSTALNAWIKAQANGSVLVFPPGSVYRLDGDAGLNVAGRNHLTLEGTGSRLINKTTGASGFSASFFLQQSEDLVIKGFAVDGGNTATGSTAAKAQVDESISAIAIRGDCKRIEVSNINWDNIRGFGPILGSDGGKTWPEDISIHDCIIRGGEMGVGIVAARRVKIERCQVNDSIDTAFDLEPDASQVGGGGFEDVLISDCDITNYGWGQSLTSWFVAACPQDAVLSKCVMNGLTVTKNRVHAGAAGPANGSQTGLGGLGVRADKTNAKHNFVITDNVTTHPDTRSMSRATMNFANVENLTVTGNKQPVTNGALLLSDTGTTGTRVVSGNTTT